MAEMGRGSPLPGPPGLGPQVGEAQHLATAALGVIRERCLPARVAEETVLLEGAAILPSQDWQARLLVKKGAHNATPAAV